MYLPDFIDHLHFTIFLHKIQRRLLLIATIILLQNDTKLYYKMHQAFYYKMRRFYYKMGKLLKSALVDCVNLCQCIILY